MFPPRFPNIAIFPFLKISNEVVETLLILLFVNYSTII